MTPMDQTIDASPLSEDILHFQYDTITERIQGSFNGTFNSKQSLAISQGDSADNVLLKFFVATRSFGCPEQPVNDAHTMDCENLTCHEDIEPYVLILWGILCGFVLILTVTCFVLANIRTKYTVLREDINVM
jgi:hypothetical protein